MGSWFSNLEIRKTERITMESVFGCIKDNLAQRKYALVEHAQDADVVVAVLRVQNSDWISICSQVFAHDDPDSCQEIAAQFSARLHTDVMGIACFDSDYLYLNLINTDENTNAWVGIGSGKEIGITRRNNLTAWKKKVTDYAAFSAAVKRSYICADELLAAVEGCLRLPEEQGSLSLDYLKDSSLQKDAVFLYFCQEQGESQKCPDLRTCYMHHAVPCFDGKGNSVYFLNLGDEFCGLSVYFLGSYVEQEEIIFSDVKLGRVHQQLINLELQRIQLSDGQWAYYCHVPEILIPPGVSQRMKSEMRNHLEMERMQKLSFVPHGNPRKMLDITVVVVPDGNPDNQAKWNVWEQYGSKEAFIKHHNKIWKQVRKLEPDPKQWLPLLNKEDFVE